MVDDDYIVDDMHAHLAQKIEAKRVCQLWRRCAVRTQQKHVQRFNALLG